jgi:uncharacterized protein (TIGR02246 family)
MERRRWNGVRAGVMAAIVLTFQAGCGPGALSDTERAGITEEVDGVVASLFEAMNAHDLDAIAGHYDDGADFVYVGCTSVRVGFENVRRIMEMWHRASPEVTFDHEVLTLRAITRDVAAATVRATTSEDTVLFWSFILRRDADGWRIAHEHESWADCPEQRSHPTV